MIPPPHAKQITSHLYEEFERAELNEFPDEDIQTQPSLKSNFSTQLCVNLQPGHDSWAFLCLMTWIYFFLL